MTLYHTVQRAKYCMGGRGVNSALHGAMLNF